MRTFIATAAVFLACGPMWAGPYYGVTQSTATGKALMNLSGTLCVADSSMTPTDCVIYLNDHGMFTVNLLTGNTRIATPNDATGINITEAADGTAHMAIGGIGPFDDWRLLVAGPSLFYNTDDSLPIATFRRGSSERVAISSGGISLYNGAAIVFADGTTQATAASGSGGGTEYSTNTAVFHIGEVYISSLTYPAFPNMYAVFRSTNVEITGVMAYAEYASTVTQTAFDIVIATQTGGTRSWSSIFTSTVPWLAANTIESNWFVPDSKTPSSTATAFAIAPRIISIPTAGTPPQISVLVRYKRRLTE